MTNFTPGPWEYKKVWQSPSYEVFREMCHIANVYGAGKKDKANARLIAAAPDMKDLLYKAHEKLADLNNNYELGDDNPVDLCFEIRKILHRIEGEEAHND